MKNWIIFIILTVCIMSIGYAQEPSPAGGNYLDLPGDGRYYAAEDDPTLDKKLGFEMTIEAWLYLRDFPPTGPDAPPLRPYRWIVFEKLESYYLHICGFKWGVITPVWAIAYEVFLNFGEGKGGGREIGINGHNVAFDVIIQTNEWHHVAIQQKGKIVTIYLKGKKVREFIFDEKDKPWRVLDLDKGFYIGGRDLKEETSRTWWWPEKIKSFNGAIDELRISNVARYQGESIALPGRFNPDPYTMALWHFDEPIGSSSYEDSSGNGNTLFLKEFNVEQRGKLPVLWGKIKNIP